ncbi:MAG: DUF1385 domain-containing protein [Eubacterium sp.]|nr:DUF1385 domain-containing protein [Eubacterium sp.]MBQ7201104.1 DUF1385 domain-containing protein [Eubacterium sp.]
MAYSGIGGQAVIEGVMMKNRDRYAVAVRKPDGKIEIQKKPSSSLRDRYKFFDLPIIRGVVTFVESFTMGMGVLNYSASFYEEDEKKDLSEAERKKAEKKESILTGIVMVIAIILAIGIFVLAPFFAMEALKEWIPSPELRGFLEGVLRVIIFIVYVKLITLVDDIKRLFMYHGAEHKSINCVENGEDLTVENVMRQSTEHRRCGTSFLLFVMVVSILFFMFIVVGQVWLRMLLRILLIPVIAGLSYELIKFLGSHEGKCVYIISRPGMWLQHLTTREPTEDIVEVAIASVNAVFDWREFQGKPPAEPEEEPETQTESASEAENNVVESVSGTEAESVPETEAAEVVESVPEPEEPVTDESFEDVVVEDL